MGLLDVTGGGKIVNTGKEPQMMPALRASLLDADKRDLFAWTFVADREVVGPGESIGFRTEAINPPDAYERPQITFVSATP